MRRSQTQKNVIRVSEQFQIPGTNLVLEEGDTILGGIHAEKRVRETEVRDTV